MSLDHLLVLQMRGQRFIYQSLWFRGFRGLGQGVWFRSRSFTLNQKIGFGGVRVKFLANAILQVRLGIEIGLEFYLRLEEVILPGSLSDDVLRLDADGALDTGSSHLVHHLRLGVGLLRGGPSHLVVDGVRELIQGGGRRGWTLNGCVKGGWRRGGG